MNNGIRGRIGLVCSVFAQQEPLVTGHYDHTDNEKNKRNGAAITKAHAPDAERVEVRHHRVGRIERVTAGERDDQVKELEGAKNAEEQGEQDNRLHHGKYDMSSYLPAISSIDASGLNYVIGHVLPPGDKQRKMKTD